MSLASVYTYILFLIFLTGTDVIEADELAKFISRLYNSALQSNKPLVLVLDKNNVREEQNYPLKPNNLVGASLDTEEEVPSAVYLIQNQVTPTPPSQKRDPPLKGLASLGNLGSFGNLGSLASLLEINLPRASHQHVVGKSQLTTSKTPSALQKLLRQSKCDANDACVEKCKKRFEGKQKKKCSVKCEITFECPPESNEDQGYDDPCESNYNTEC